MATKQFQNAKLNVTHLDLKDDASRSVLQSGENISHSLGKIARWYKDIIWTDSKATTEVFGIVKLSDDYKSESTETVPTSKTLNDVVKLIKQTGGWNTTYDFNSNIEGDENLQNGQFKVTEHDLEGDIDHYVSIKGLGSAAFTDADEYATAGHTHLYAGSASVGGPATSANKLNTDAGSDVTPIYFSNGIPVACTYSLNKTVPSNALFTDENVTQTATTTNENFEILFSSTADNTTRTEGARKNSNLTFNPSTGTLTATKFVGELSGNATTATTANKLSNTTAIGSSIKPVYFSADGVPVAIDCSIETSVPSNAVFTDTTYTVSSGDNNGQIKVTPSEGDPYNVSVKGLGSAAYTDSDDYATADHTHKYAGSSSVGGVANSAAKLSDIPAAGIGSETKPVFFSGTTGRPIACTYSLNATVPANAIFTDEKVKQSPVTTDGSFEVLFAGSTGNTAKTEGVGKTTTLTFNPSTGALSAMSFSGNGSGLASLNATNISSGTLSVNRLPGSAVTVGTYGPAAGGTLSHSGTFDVPDFTVDAKGRITGAHTRTFTLPTQYVHPTHTSKTSGLYKITVNSLGHVSATASVTKTDIPVLDYVSSTTTRNANTVLAGPISGAAAAPTFRTLVANDLPSHTHTKSDITDFPTSLKNPNSLTVQGNGTASFTYDGSVAKTLNIKPGTGISVSSDTSGNITITNTSTNTDTKVTAVGNHYTPSGGTTTSASGGTLTDITNSSSGIQVVTGVTKDAAGHVTGVTSKALKSVNTNTTYSFASGDSNGQIKVTPSSGTAYNVSVKGLGSAAYTASTKYVYKDNTSDTLSQFDGAPSYLLGIESFTNGGTVKWQSASSVSVGSATKASKLSTARTINGVKFDGTANIIVPRSIKHIHYANGTNGTSGYVKICTVGTNAAYGDQPIRITIGQRRISVYDIFIVFENSGSAKATIRDAYFRSNRSAKQTPEVHYYLNSNGYYDIYVKKTESQDHIFIMDYLKSDGDEGDHVELTWTNTIVSTLPSGSVAMSNEMSRYYDSKISRTANTVLAAPNGSAGSATFRALVAADLPASGATAGSYGPSANTSPAHSGTFSVPYITVDAKGRVTAISTKTITLPASGNTDTKNTAGSTNTSSKIFLIGATSQAANPQTYSHDTAYVGTDGCLYSNSTKVSVEGHTHGYLPLAGGTMTGDITFAGVSSTEYPALSNQIYFSGSTDWARILYEVTASDAGQLVFETGDDANAKIVFRNKVTSGGTYTRQVTIADGIISGNGSGLTSLNASNISSGTLSADRLATSGATAGSYGPSANATPGYGSTFNVPYITVDNKGRVTAISTKTVKIPASDNTNTTYTFATGDNNGTFKVTPSGGTAKNIAIKGLGSAAYTASSAYATSGHTHGLGHSNFTVAIDATTNTWAAIGVDGTNKYVLKSIRTNTNAPPYLLNDFSAGIVFGGEDTRGVISMKYNTPSIRFAGGNKTAADGGTAVWYITLTGTHNTTYNLNTINQVTQTATTTSAAYEVLFSGTADNTTRTEGARKNSNLTFNPSTGTLTATKFDGQIVGKKYEDYDPFSTKHDHHPVLFYQDNFGSPSKVGYASLGFTYDSIHGELFSGGMNCGVLNTKIIDMSGTTDDPNSEINYKGTKATHTMIKFVDNAGDTSGNGIVIGGGGLVVVGAGESANNLVSAASLPGGQEKLYLTSDSEIYFYVNCNTIGDRKGITLNTSLSFYPNSNNTGTVGTSSNKWNAMYANTFYGAFSGSGASVTSLNASNISSGTLSADRLATSGVTAGSYGPSTNASPAHSGTFNVPYITVDNKGRVMAIATRTITLPASGNTDANVKQSATSTANFRGVILGTNNTVNTGDNRETTVTGQGYITNKIFAQPSTGNLYASNIYAFANGTDEVRITLYRSGNSSWRFVNNGGTLSLQNNYYSDKVQSWYNVAQFNHGGTNAIKLMTPPQLTGTNRSTTYGYSTIDMAICSKNSWAMSMRWLNNARNAVRGSFGAYGTADNLTYYYWGNEYNSTKLRLYPGTGGGLVSQQSNGFRIATNGYGVIFRVDSDNFYILLTDKKTDGSELTGDNWNSKRPLQIGLSSGICNINGTASTAKKLKYCTLCNEASDAASYPWYRIAYAYTTGTYVDLNLVMMVTCGYGSKWGIFKARARTEGKAGTFGGTVTIEWIVNHGFTNAQLYLLVKNNYQVDTAKSGTATAEIWFKSDGRYWGYTFTVLHEGWRTGTASDLWALSSYSKNGSENYNKNASGVKSATSSKIYSTNTPGSSSITRYSIPFFEGPIDSSSPGKNDTAASGNKTVLHNGEFRLGLLEGTTSTDGYVQLVLGNEIASGTAGNKYGKISLYSSSAYAVQIIPAKVTATRTITLPNESGTVALTSHTHSYIPTSSAKTLFSGTAAASITMTSMSGYTRLVVFCKNTSNSSYFTVELQCVTGYHYHAMTVSPPPAAQTNNSFYGLLFNLSSNTKLSVSAGKYSNLSSSASLANGPTVHITKVIGYKF